MTGIGCVHALESMSVRYNSTGEEQFLKEDSKPKVDKYLTYSLLGSEWIVSLFFSRG